MNKVATLAEIRPTSAIDVPDTKVAAREAFDIETDMVVPAFSVRTEHVPDIDSSLFCSAAPVVAASGMIFQTP
jgi:cobaltochelatase CobS